jgi:hypothetical protein
MQSLLFVGLIFFSRGDTLWSLHLRQCKLCFEILVGLLIGGVPGGRFFISFLAAFLRLFGGLAAWAMRGESGILGKICPPEGCLRLSALLCVVLSPFLCIRFLVPVGAVLFSDFVNPSLYLFSS